MNRHRILFLASLWAVGGALACLTACTISLPFHRRPPDDEKKIAYKGKPTSQGLLLEMKASPEPLKLSETPKLAVTLIVRNVSKKVVTLKFPTTQLIEILLRDPNSGQIISQWSTEQQFTSDPRLLVINPGERLEYNESITTRELKSGKAYTLEAYFIGFDKELRVTKAVLPQA